MRPLPPPNHPHFTAILSAAEEADAKIEHDSWDNEGGHMSSASGRVVRTPGADLPYKAVLAHGRSANSHHAFATMKEAEAFIRRRTPVPPAALSALYDRPAGDA